MKLRKFAKVFGSKDDILIKCQGIQGSFEYNLDEIRSKYDDYKVVSSWIGIDSFYQPALYVEVKEI